MSQPCPLVVVENHDGHRFTSRFEKMGQILRQPQYADKELAIISVVGTTRRGKSFLVNLLLMYLYGHEFDMSSLFSFRGGVEAETKGIYMWSEPFIKRLPSGKEVVVVLMDTQGTFDNQTTTTGNSIVFGLSTILSSVQIFNIMDNISEDDLKHLTMFSQFASMACKSSTQNKKTFQNLIFLIRDWINDNNYGFAGGDALLEKVLKIEGRPEGLQSLRKTLIASFENIYAFPCPDPGAAVKSPGFRGNLRDCSPAFQTQVIQFFNELMSPRFLQPKRINGRAITCYDAQDIFNEYFQALLRNPTAENLITATENLQFSAAYNAGVKEFSEFIGHKTKDGICHEKFQLEEDLMRKKNDIIDRFPIAKTVSTLETSRKHLETLEAFMKEQIGKVLKQNEEKVRYEKALEDRRQIEENHQRNQQKREMEKKRREPTSSKTTDRSQIDQQQYEHRLREEKRQNQHNEDMRRLQEEEQRLRNKLAQTRSSRKQPTLEEQESYLTQRISELEEELARTKAMLKEVRAKKGKSSWGEKLGVPFWK